MLMTHRRAHVNAMLHAGPAAHCCLVCDCAVVRLRRTGKIDRHAQQPPREHMLPVNDTRTTYPYSDYTMHQAIEKYMSMLSPCVCSLVEAEWVATSVCMAEVRA